MTEQAAMRLAEACGPEYEVAFSLTVLVWNPEAKPKRLRLRRSLGNGVLAESVTSAATPWFVRVA